MRNNEDRFGSQQTQDASPVQQIMQEELTKNTTASPLNFIVPTDYISLPSKGKFYPKEHPLHNSEVIEVRQMTAKEEDMLTSKSLLKKGVALDKVMQSIIVQKVINIDTLTVEDRNAIIVGARIGAYGSDYATTITCPSCETKVKYNFNLMEKVLESTEEQEEQFEVESDGTFKIVLPSTKWELRCKALNGYDEKNLLRLSESKKNTVNDSLLLDQLKMMVVSVQGVTDRQIIEKAIAALPASDSRFLRKEYQKVVKPFDMRQNFVCNSCSHEAVLEVPLSADFFWFK